MFVLAVLVLQAVLILGAAVAGAWLTGGLNRRTAIEAAEPAPTTQHISALDVLPAPDEASVGDIQRGMNLLTTVITRLQTGVAEDHEYEEARRLAQWTLQAGQAAEHRLARQIEAEDPIDDRLDIDTATKVIERGLNAGISQRVLAQVTGWSKTWVAEQSKRLTLGS